MSALAKLHIAKKQLGLDDDTYRAVLERVTGKRSAKLMTVRERESVLADFRQRGFVDRKSATGDTTTRKITALWLSGWNLGVIADRRSSALEAFVKRMTGIDKVQWLRDPRDAGKVIDTLKAWLAREAGVQWSRNPMDDVIAAQVKRLAEIDGTIIHSEDASSTIETQRSLGRMIRTALSTQRRRDT